LEKSGPELCPGGIAGRRQGECGSSPIRNTPGSVVPVGGRPVGHAGAC
jgi:hypothetical protein